MLAATAKNHLNIVKLLIENKARTDITNNHGDSVFTVASANKDSTEILKVLLESNDEVKRVSHMFSTF